MSKETRYRKNIASFISLLWSKPIGLCCLGDILSEKENNFSLPPPLL
jgi:hypothetical protein